MIKPRKLGTTTVRIIVWDVYPKRDYCYCRLLDAFFRGSGGTITSTATLSADTGGELQLRGEWISDGSITVTDAVLDIGGAIGETWDNNGTITLSNATLELGGSYTVADIGTVTGTGTVILDGSLDNTGMTLDVGVDLPGTTVLLGNNGVIVGGSVVNTALVLPGLTSFTLDNVTLGANLTIEAGASLFVDDDLTLAGATITLASDNNFTYLRFRAISGNTATVGGTGEVVLGGTTTVDNRNVIMMATSADGLVIGSGVTIRSDTTGGRIYHQNNNGPITLQGTLISDVPGRTVQIGGNPLSIEGNLQAAAGSVIEFTSDYSLTATAELDVDIGGTATTDFGRYTAVGRTASLDGVVNMTLVNSFTPVLGNTFGIMTFGTRNGTIGAGTGTIMGGGLSFQVNNNTTDVTLEVVD